VVNSGGFGGGVEYENREQESIGNANASANVKGGDGAHYANEAEWLSTTNEPSMWLPVFENPDLMLNVFSLLQEPLSTQVHNILVEYYVRKNGKPHPEVQKPFVNYGDIITLKHYVQPQHSNYIRDFFSWSKARDMYLSAPLGSYSLYPPLFLS
jgi:hypothetical protein